MDVGPGDLEGDQHLDHELVARGRHEVGRGAQPVGQLAVTGGRDPVALLRSLAFAVVGLDEPVPLEALERRVHLADVERPDLARPRLELVLQPQAVLRPLAEQGKERMGDAHGRFRSIAILSMYTKYCHAAQRSLASDASRARTRSARWPLNACAPLRAPPAPCARRALKQRRVARTRKQRTTIAFAAERCLASDEDVQQDRPDDRSRDHQPDRNEDGHVV